MWLSFSLFLFFFFSFSGSCCKMLFLGEALEKQISYANCWGEVIFLLISFICFPSPGSPPSKCWWHLWVLADSKSSMLLAPESCNAACYPVTGVPHHLDILVRQCKPPETGGVAIGIRHLTHALGNSTVQDKHSGLWPSIQGIGTVIVHPFLLPKAQVLVMPSSKLYLYS